MTYHADSHHEVAGLAAAALPLAVPVFIAINALLHRREDDDGSEEGRQS